jgi:hypothetical protein
MTIVEKTSSLFHEPFDFSLVLGGPLYQIWRRAHLTGDTLELVFRRVVVTVLVGWVPLLVLSALGGRATGDAIKIPFLHDIEAHARFFLALPLLIAAELVVHLRNRVVMRRFVDRRIVRPEDIPRFDAALTWGLRLRNSVLIEVALLVLCFTFGQWVWRSQVALNTDTWYATVEGARWQLTVAGYWYAFISIPVFQFILIRWYFRFFIWFGVLWHISRIPLNLTATHPDRAGGLAFLGKSAYAFGPIMFAQGCLLAGLIANRVLYEGATLLSFKMEAGSLIVFFVLIVLGPLVMFTPHLSYVKRKGLGTYGLLASAYVQEFEEKWVDRKSPQDGELLGTADIQSLADLANSYAVVREMRIIPFGLDDVTRLAAMTAAPLLPLGLTVLSFEDLVVRVAKIIF